MSEAFMRAIKAQDYARNRYVDDALAGINCRFTKAEKRQIWELQAQQFPVKEIARITGLENKHIIAVLKRPTWPTPTFYK